MQMPLSPTALLKAGASHPYKAWWVCFSAAFFFFYEFIQMHMFNAINLELREAFHVTATGLSMLSSTYLLGDLIFLLPAGFLLDRFSVRSILLISIAVCIVGTWGFAGAHNLYWAAFFHVLSGCGNAFCFLSCIMLVSRWFPPKRQAFVIGLVVTCAFLGGAVAQTPLAWLASTVGWRLALLYDGILGFFVMLLIFIHVVDHPFDAHDPEVQKHTQTLGFVKSFAQVIKNRQNWLGGIYTSFLNLPIMVLDAIWGIAYLQKVYGLNTLQASHVTSMIFFGSMLGCPLVGWISDHMSLRCKPMVVGAILSLLCMLAIIFIPNLSYTWLVLLFFLIGVFTSTQIITYPWVAESNPPMITGTAMGFVSLLIMGGAAVAQVLFGKLLDLQWQGLIDAGQRIYSVGNYQFAMLLFPIAIAIALASLFLARETYCHSQYK